MYGVDMCDGVVLAGVKEKKAYECYFFFQAEDGIRDTQESRGARRCV